MLRSGGADKLLVQKGAYRRRGRGGVPVQLEILQQRWAAVLSLEALGKLTLELVSHGQRDRQRSIQIREVVIRPEHNA